MSNLCRDQRLAPKRTTEQGSTGTTGCGIVGVKNGSRLVSVFVLSSATITVASTTLVLVLVSMVVFGGGGVFTPGPGVNTRPGTGHQAPNTKQRVYPKPRTRKINSGVLGQMDQRGDTRKNLPMQWWLNPLALSWSASVA
jgi:hypothetical protein